MIIMGIIILIITLAVCIGVMIRKNKEFYNGFLFGVVIAMGISSGISLITIDVIEPTPTAMDVYQGKTTLKITYKDDIPTDSVVVFKD